jgi:hypothetical protein
MNYLSVFFLLCHLLVVTAQESAPSNELLEMLAAEKKKAQESIPSKEVDQKFREEADAKADAKRQVIEQELEIVAKAARILIANNNLPAANQLRDTLIRGWHLDVYMTNKKLYVLLQEFSRVKDEVIRNELVRSVIKGILDHPELATVLDQILATKWLIIDLATYPVERLDKLREESNEIFVQCVSQWSAKIIPDDQIPKPGSINFSPGGDYDAGISPEAIKEPDVRANYEMKRAEAGINSSIRSTQGQIDYAGKSRFPLIFIYINELNKDDPKAKRAVFDQIDAIAVSEKKTKVWLMNALAKAFGYNEQ